MQLVLKELRENQISGVDYLYDTIDRLQDYASVGADVVFAPGMSSPEQIRRDVVDVDVPVSVLVRPGVPPIAELADLGVARVSVGGVFALAGLGDLAAAATELQEQGTYGFWETAAAAVPLRAAFD